MARRRRRSLHTMIMACCKPRKKKRKKKKNPQPPTTLYRSPFIEQPQPQLIIKHVVHTSDTRFFLSVKKECRLRSLLGWQGKHAKHGAAEV